MIKIKVFSIRQAINSFIFSIIIIGFIIFLIFMMASLMYVIKNEFEKNLFKENKKITNEVFSKQLLANKILKNEISALNLLSVDDFSEETEQQKELKEKFEYDYAKAENNLKGGSVNEKNDENVNITITEVLPKYTLPEKYEVEKYSNGNIRVENTKIINYSKKDLNLEELSKPSKVNIDTSKNFLIFHTHATESYTVPNNSSIVNYRTTDEKYNMISIGNTLIDCLKSKGFECVHDKLLHDYPSYNGAYKSSLNTVQEYLKEKEYDFVIDVHRDALSSNLNFRPTVEINGEKVAKLMFVVGTNAAGLTHDKWMENLKLALMIQNRANEMYPGLFRDLHLSNSRYNQHVSEGAFIIEVGATGNTLEEAKNSMKYLSNVINSFRLGDVH